MGSRSQSIKDNHLDMEEDIGKDCQEGKSGGVCVSMYVNINYIICAYKIVHLLFLVDVSI